MTPPILLAVPNVSEGRDMTTIAAIGAAFSSDPGADEIAERSDVVAGRRSVRGTDRLDEEPRALGGVRLLDVHSDRDHHRSVFTLAGSPPALADALLRGARVAVERIDVQARAGLPAAQAGAHPHVGAIDVVPLVYLDRSARGAACAEALVVAERIGEELQVPVFMYGELAGGGAGSTRAALRRGGVRGLAERMALDTGADDARRPDFGPARMHPSAGASLVAAREPLVAFNLQLQAPASVADARQIAAQIREGGEQGLPGVRAIGLALDGGVAQVSMNIERPLELALAEVVAAVARHAPIASAELVGLAPRAALAGFPTDLPLGDFDPARHVIENALGS